MKRKVSVWLDYFEEFSVEEAIARLAKAGFAYGELSLTHLGQLMDKGDPAAAGKALGQTARDCGYAIPQGHLSFIGGLCDDAALERLKPEVDMFAAAGISKAVLHASGGLELPEQERYDRRVHYIRRLSEYAEGTGVTFCIENLPSDPFCNTATAIKKLIADAGGRNLAICLDTGHLHLSRERKLTEQSHREFIQESGTLLQALHITDNNGSVDTHQLPYSARFGLDWRGVMQGLNEVDYQGLFNLEILGERVAPLPIREAKLAYAHALCDYMLSPEFLTDPYVPLPYDRR